MNLLLVRHGEIPSNINKVYAGRSAEGLTPEGICQAQDAAEKLKMLEVKAIYSSPIQRAVQTAQIISKRTGMDFQVEAAFREMELGPWEGLSEDEIAKTFPEEWKTWNSRPDKLRLPGRETLEQLLGRVMGGIRSIYQNAGDGKTVIVTHVAVIRVLLLWSAKKGLNLYKTIHVPNAEIFEISVAENVFP